MLGWESTAEHAIGGWLAAERKHDMSHLPESGS